MTKMARDTFLNLKNSTIKHNFYWSPLTVIEGVCAYCSRETAVFSLSLDLCTGLWYQQDVVRPAGRNECWASDFSTQCDEGWGKGKHIHSSGWLIVLSVCPPWPSLVQSPTFHKIVLAPVVQKVDSAIHWINHYPLERLVSLILIQWIVLVIFWKTGSRSLESSYCYGWLFWLQIYQVDGCRFLWLGREGKKKRFFFRLLPNCPPSS